MAVFREELTWSPELFSSRDVFVSTEANRITGYVSLRRVDTSTVDLEHLFVEPDCFGLGIGRRFFEHAWRWATDEVYKQLTVMSAPNAAGFYDRVGCRKVADIPSSIPSRSIPTFEYSLQLKARE